MKLFNKIVYNPIVNYEELLSAIIWAKMSYLEPNYVTELWIDSTVIDIVNDDNYLLYIYLKYLATPPKYICNNDVDAQAYIFTKQNKLYIVFRGTSSKNDILIDLDIRTHKIKDNIYVHNGFYKQFKSLENQINESIDDYKNIDEIVFIGHSLGAGIAQIASAIYADILKDKKVSCITFGCPRTGNNNFVKWFNNNIDKHVRIANKNDIVTMIPLRPVWEHTTNQSIIISDDCVPKLEITDIPWYKRLYASFINIDYDAPIKDHGCDVYIERLLTIIQKQL